MKKLEREIFSTPEFLRILELIGSPISRAGLSYLISTTKGHKYHLRKNLWNGNANPKTMGAKGYLWHISTIDGYCRYLSERKGEVFNKRTFYSKVRGVLKNSREEGVEYSVVEG